MNLILNKYNSLIEEQLNIKSKIISKYTKELYGYPPGKNKKGKPPQIDKLKKLLLT